MIARKAISYAGFFLVLMAVLGELGVKLTALLGAAGIVGIAVGFASQTSVSNIISGLFLISEKPFAVGDVIRIGTTTGIIQSIDLLSIKIRTFDNLFVRIPNEKILTSEVTNITRFPIRRMDIVFQVDYGQDLTRVHGILAEIARDNPWSLDEPSRSSCSTISRNPASRCCSGLWFAKTDFMDLKNSIMKDISVAIRARRASGSRTPTGLVQRRGPRASRGPLVRRSCQFPLDDLLAARAHRDPRDRGADPLLDEKDVVPRAGGKILEPAHRRDVCLPARQLLVDRGCLVQQPGDRESRRSLSLDGVGGADRDRVPVAQDVEVRDGRLGGALDAAPVRGGHAVEPAHPARPARGGAVLPRVPAALSQRLPLLRRAAP